MKSAFKKIAAFFVALGKSLMLPIAVLPIAGLLLRFGQADMLNIQFLAEAGNAVFSNLPIIFALGVAVGFSKEEHGAAAISAFVGYVVMTAALKVLNADLNMGVLGGIIIGVTAGLLYNRFKNIKLPTYLAFFGGRRFIPIITGLFAVCYALIFSITWAPIQHIISAFGNWVIKSNNIGLFFFGVANRLLIPLGLHHVLNNFIWFQFGDFTVVEAGVQVVKHGDLWRFFAGDPNAGAFMAGFFPIMMFGLPAAAFAMVLESYKENRKATAGILLSAALTSFLTGITEPIEFAFMFLAFPLYVLHAVLTGISMVIMNICGAKLGFTFSAGLFDYLLNWGISTKPGVLLPVGLAYGVLYFFIFRFSIRKWNLTTPGRETVPSYETAPAMQNNIPQQNIDTQQENLPQQNSRGAKYLSALGGKDNLKTLGACATRLRLEVFDEAKINVEELKALGARGILSKEGLVQIIIGPEADLINDEIKQAAGDLR
ncbi:MAG: N-acetylglucosamine-specific PTS transporter subunit IIBC [Elusimicrobiaceae bacterium]|nr:N-acetylglucosamine-specific PTS transporter subunit IIBC [Elusimicrobiaceae bacterium]